MGGNFEDAFGGGRKKLKNRIEELKSDLGQILDLPMLPKESPRQQSGLKH